jgi:hypothetical protein
MTTAKESSVGSARYENNKYSLRIAKSEFSTTHDDWTIYGGVSQSEKLAERRLD